MKKILFSLLALTLMVCSGCEKINSTEASVTIGGDSYQTTLNDVTIVVKPQTLKVYEDVTISATHSKGSRVSLTLSSASLGFDQTITTPAIITKQITTEGIHDLAFTYKSRDNTVSVSTTITAVK